MDSGFEYLLAWVVYLGFGVLLGAQLFAVTAARSFFAKAMIRGHFIVLAFTPAEIAEFPMHERVFVAARQAGDWIVLGAPNAMRGGSHLGSPGAANMIRRGLCDILASDYFYPAMMGAMVRLLFREMILCSYTVGAFVSRLYYQCIHPVTWYIYIYIYT